MAIETLNADGNGAGTCTTPANAVGAANGTWTTDTGVTSWTHEWPLANPTGSPLSSGHTVRAWVRKNTGQTGTPSAILVLRQGASTLATSSSQNITSGTGQFITFDPGTVSIADATDLRVEIRATAAGGNAATRTSVQVDYIEVLLDTQTVSAVSQTVAMSWNVEGNSETIYAASMGGHSGGLTTLETPSNAFGAANDVVTTNTQNPWFAIFNMDTPVATIMPETATLNVRAVASGAGTSPYTAWLYEGDREVEQIVAGQATSGTLTTRQHTVNLGKIKDPSQIQIRIDGLLNSGPPQIDAVWIDLTPPSGKVVATVNSAWNVEDNAGTVATWDFYYPDTTPEPTTVGPGWTVSNWSVGAGGLNSGLGTSGSDTDEVYRNYFTGGAQPNTAYSTEPVARTGSTASSASAAVTADKYIEMTFSRADAGAFTPDAIAFKAARGGSSAGRGLVIRSSADSYAADIGTVGDFPTQRPTWTNYNIDLSGIGEVTSLTLRFYIYTDGVATATIEMDDFVLTGTPSATTTPVSQTAAMAWDIEAPVSQTAAMAWDVLTPVSQTAAMAWDVQESVSQTAAMAWDVQESVSQTAAMAWGVQESVSQTAAMAWDIQESVSQTAAMAWDVQESVSQTVATAWNIEAIGAVSQTVVMAWDIREAVEATVQSAWDVNTAVSASAAIAWSARESVGQALSSSWSVLEAVTSTVTSAWSSSSFVGENLAIAWNVETIGAVGQTVAIGWNVAAEVGQTVAIGWNVNATAAVSQTVAMAWDVLQTAGASVQTEWVILQPVETSLMSAWSVRAYTSASLTSAWDVRETTGDSIGLGWNALITVGDTRDMEWAVREAVLATVDMEWIATGGPVDDVVVTATLGDRRHGATMGDSRFTGAVGARRIGASI